MINGKITNITLEKGRFRVFMSFNNDVEESTLMHSESTPEDIQNHLESRINYFNELEEKLLVLKEELIE